MIAKQLILSDNLLANPINFFNDVMYWMKEEAYVEIRNINVILAAPHTLLDCRLAWSHANWSIKQ